MAWEHAAEIKQNNFLWHGHMQQK